MVSLKDTFHNLKTSILGTKTVDIDSKLNQAVKDISSYRSNSGRNGYIDLVRSLITKSTGGDLSLENTGGLFGQGATSPATFGQGGRIMRYKTYESIIGNINYCFRALNVLVDNVLSPDDITKISLDIKSKTLLGTEEVPTESKITAIKECLKILKLEENLNIIVKNTLLFGDFFCEVADAKTALTSKALLAEHLEEAIRNGTKEIINIKEKETIKKVIIDYSSFNETTSSDIASTPNTKKNIEPKNLNLVFHEPKRIVKLQSDLFPLCFGYLIFPVTTLNPQHMMHDQVVNSICTSILKSLEQKIPQIAEHADDDYLKQIISSMIKETDPSKALNIRYIPPDKIQHFQVPSMKYYPYGESVFDSCQFTAKVLIALETALAVQRLSRSTEKRKIGIELGLPRDARKMVEKLKEEFRKRKITLDSFGTVDTIPSMITTFEDIYIPQKDGKPFVDISSFTDGNVDIRGKVDELKFLRDSVVSSLGVPASFLNIEENLCISLKSFIKLVDGRTITLEKLIEEHNEGIEHEVYSYDNDLGVIFSNKVKWAGKTKLQTKITRVHLDNGKYVDCTPEHPFMLRNGTYKEAQYLKENESLMPLYCKKSYWKTTRGHYYEVYHPGINVWELEHKSFYQYHYGPSPYGYDIHHINGNPKDVRSCNLIRLSDNEHMAVHSRTRGYTNKELEELIINKEKFNKLKKPGLKIVYEERFCTICGTEFLERHIINRTTCSKKCRLERKRLDGIKSYKLRKKKNGNKIREDLTCFICGQPTKWINVELTDKRYNQLKHCCLSCDDPKCKSRIRAVSILTKRGTKLHCEIEYSTCVVCNNPTILSDDKQRELNVCSLRCVNTVLARRGAEKKKQSAATIVNCRECKKEFEVPNWVKKSTKTHRCPECRNPKSISNNMKIEKTQKVLNHKVVKIELLEGLHDTGDINVEKYSNFAVDAGIIVHNSNKAALGEENILFARTIVGHQKYITKDINELIKKIFDIIDPEMSLTLFDHVTIALPSPKSLQFERESKYISDLATLIESLERLGVPKEWSKRKYLTNIDWEEVDNFGIDDTVEKKLGTAKKDDDAGGMGGMGGMGTAF